MNNQRAPLPAVLVFLAACGGHAVEQEHAAGRDSVPVHVTPTTDVRLEVTARLDTTSGGGVDPASAPADMTSAIPDSALIADSALVVAIVRWDGIVAPFATFGDGEWRQVHRRAFDLRIARVPISTWHYFAPRGPRRIVHADTVVDPLECDMYESWGQATDLDPSTLPWRELFEFEESARWAADQGCPVARIGIALSDNLPLVRMIEMDTAGTQATRLLELVRSLFDEKESDRIGHFREDPENAVRYSTGHPRTVADRARVPIRISDLESTKGPEADDIRLSRFVVTRTYPPTSRQRPECPVETSLEGFVVGDDRVAFIGEGVSVRGACSDAPGMQGTFIEPYGLVELDDRWFLLALQHDYEWSAPVIYEIDQTGLTEIFLGWEQ